MATLGVAVHGAGWVSGEHIKAYTKNPNTEVRVVSSRKAESARARAERDDCSAEHVRLGRRGHRRRRSSRTRSAHGRCRRAVEGRQSQRQVDGRVVGGWKCMRPIACWAGSARRIWSAR